MPTLKEMSIVKSFYLLVLLVVILPEMISSLIFLRIEKNSLDTEQYKFQTQTIQTLATVMQKPLYNFEHDTYIPIIEYLSKNEKILNIRVYDFENVLFFTKKFTRKEINEVKTIKCDVIYSGQIIGKIEVDFNHNTYLQYLGHYSVILSILLGQLTLSMIILIYYFKVKIIQPISYLKEQAVKLSRNILDTPVKHYNNDELGALSNSFESMRQSLKEHIDKLDQLVDSKTKKLNKLNHVLEHKIEELEIQRSRFTLAIDGSQNGLWDWNIIEDSVFYSKRWKEMLGYSEDEIDNSIESWHNLIHPEDIENTMKDFNEHLNGKTPVFENKHRIKRKDGSWMWVLSRGKALIGIDAKPIRIVGFNADITKDVKHQQELEHSAKHDSLTKLPNRFLLNQLLQNQMYRCKRNSDTKLAVLFIDLDGFKEVNDVHGHEAGDFVLITIAKRLQAILRQGDIVARLGGDEFVLGLSDLKNRDELLPLAQRLLHDLSQVIYYHEYELYVSASIGIALYPQTPDIGSDALLRQADQAMYTAKNAGKNQYSFF